MISTFARVAVPVLGRLDVSGDVDGVLPDGCVIAANHTSPLDPGLVLVALHRMGVEPVVMAAAGLWRVPVLGARLAAEGHIPVHRGSVRAREALERAEEALRRGRTVVIYPEGGLPTRPDAAEKAPGPFRSGLARLAAATGALVVPLGQAGARSISSGGTAKQIAGALSAPVRRPRLHVHIGAPVRLEGSPAEATEQARAAVVRAWRIAAERGGHHCAAADRSAPDVPPGSRRAPGSWPPPRP